MIHRTIDSWDFATTISSPGSSIRRHLAFDLTSNSDEEDANSMFSPYDDLEEDYDPTKGDVFWDSDDDVLELPSSKRTEAIPIPFSPECPPSKAADTSSRGEDTPPSASESPLMTPKSQAITSAEAPDLEETPVLPPSVYDLPPSETIYPLVLGEDPKPKAHLSNKPMKAPITPPPPHSPRRRAATASGPTGSYGLQNRRDSQSRTNPNSQGIWQKIRTNVRRSSFRGGAVSPFAGKAMNMIGNKTDTLNPSLPSHEAVQMDPGVPERKESSVGRFASKGKHALNRKSSWMFRQ